MQDGNRRSNNAQPENTHRSTALENKDKKDDTHEDGSINRELSADIFTEREIFEEFNEYGNISGTEDDDSSAIASPVRSNKSADLDPSIKSKKKLVKGTKTETDNLLEKADYDNFVSGLLKKYKVGDV